MKDLLEYIVKNLVSNPDAVVVEEESQDGNVNLYLTVDPTDMGIVIGKGGQTIHSLRKILTVRAISENVRVNLQLTEPSPSAEASGDKEGSEKKVEAEEPEDLKPEASKNKSQEANVEEENAESVVNEEPTNEVPEATDKEEPEEGASEEK